MNEASQALQKIARGTGIVFAGTIISMFFGFLSRAIIARYFSTGEYGVFNLALTVLSIALVIATLGFQNALPREVAFYREREPSRVGDLVSTALIIVAVNSIIWMVILFLGAGDISQVFKDARLIHALRIIVFALPFSALTGTVISISRGFGRVREKVYFQNIVYPTAFLVFIALGAFLNFPFTYVFSAYVLAQVITLLALTFDVRKAKLFEFRTSLDLKLGRELLVFSVPLMLTGILGFIMNWTDTLMLGYYLTPELVGIYNAAAPLARMLRIFLNSTGFLYMPLASQLYAQGKVRKMGRVYQILTKWVFSLTLPFFAFVFLFPEVTINFFFGARYLGATKALQILAFGFMFNTFLGLNGVSLIVIGESRFMLLANLIPTLLNIILNALLIPAYGVNGGAMATALSYVISNIINSARIYQKVRIQPFSWDYVKSLFISFILIVLIQSLHLKLSNIWHSAFFLVVFLGVYFLLLLFTRGIDKEDVELLLAIERKLGIDIKILKKLLKRFV